MKEKGFTLIELLAVIVILAVIALIATPIVLNIINNAKKSSFKASAYGIVRAANYYFGEQLLDSGISSNVTLSLTDGSLKYTGNVPDSGSVTITPEGRVSLVMTKGSWCVKYENDTATLYENVNNDVECRAMNDTIPTPSNDTTTNSQLSTKLDTIISNQETIMSSNEAIEQLLTNLGSSSSGSSVVKSIQRGTDSGNKTITITTVDASKSIILLNGGTTIAGSSNVHETDSGCYISAFTNNSFTVSGAVVNDGYYGYTSNVSYSWQVIEFY